MSGARTRDIANSTGSELARPMHKYMAGLFIWGAVLQEVLNARPRGGQ